MEVNVIKENNNSRENNWDFFRVLCAFGVIMIHVSATYIESYRISYPFEYDFHIKASIVYNSFSRFAVPGFLMLSGAFLLQNDKNKEFRRFYRKSFVKLGVPTIIFTVIYFLYTVVLNSILNYPHVDIIKSIILSVKQTLRGVPYYHMWYMYALIGIYAFIPIIIRLRNDIGEKAFKKVSYIVFAVTILSGMTSNNYIQWSITNSVSHIGYVMIGYVIKTDLEKKKDNKKGVCLIVLSLICYLGFSSEHIRYRRMI